MGIDAPTTITNCTFTGNKAASNYGGAISSGHYGKLTITDCTFTENSSQNSGGGIYMNGEPESKISNCVITKNTSGNYGGGFATGAFFGGRSANVTFESCDITNNMSTGRGAGLYLGGGTQTLTSCDISGNVISGDGSGAGVYAIHAGPKFINCNVSNNKTNYSSGGGGFYFSNVPDDNGVEITNCTISGNSAPVGGGLAFEDGPATITNCTFTGNRGGVYSNHVLFKGTMDFINCTIVNNTSADQSEFYLPYAKLSLTNTLIWNDSADKIFNTNDRSALSLDHCALPESFTAEGSGAITNDSPVYVSTDWTPVSSEIDVDGIIHTVYEVGSSSGINHELDVLLGAALSDDNTPKYDQIGRVRKNLTVGALEGNKVIFEIHIDSGITHGALSSDRSLASKDVKVTLTVSPDTGYYTSSVTYSGDTVKAEVISADGIYSFNMPSEDITVSAVFSEIIYPISYDPKGGSVSPSNPATYTIESPDFTLTNPTRVGYVFSGWTGTGIDGTAEVVTVTTGSYGAREYTATWTPIIYALKYDESGGTVTPDNPATYTIESPDIKLNNPTRTGYTFAGWTGTAIEGTSSAVTIANGSYGARSYTATWTPINYSIKYHLDGGTASDNPTAYNIESGDLKLKSPTKKGYEFEGWTLSGDQSGEISSDVTIPTGTIGNREYIANWKLVIYTISYDLKEGTVSPSNPSRYTIETETFTLNNPLKDCYTFEGWTGTSLDALSKSVTIPKGSTGNREYTANYTPITYALSYDLQGGTLSKDNPTSYDIESDDIKLNNPLKTGYDFTGWSFDNTLSIDVTIPKGSSGDKKFTATWTPTIYTISYDLDGGTVSTPNPTTYTIETPSFTLNNPTRTGYTFAGWKGTDINGTAETVTVLQGSTGNRSYTAVWSSVTYTITYNLNNAQDPGNPATYTIESGAITLTNPSRDGYTFDGWTGTDLTAKTQSVTIPSGSTGNREYTANFTPITYTLTYNLNGGTATNPTSYTIETETFTLNNPVKAEYSFTGWTGSGLNEAQETVTIAKGSTGNKTFTANYEVASAPVLAETSLTLKAFKGQPASVTVTATEGAEIEWSVTTGLPSGLGFSGSGKSAAISGTPQLGTSGTYSATVTATNPKGSAAANVAITVANDFAQSGDVKEGTRRTEMTSSGMTRTNKATSFTNGAGSLILSADIAITAEAEEFIKTAHGYP
ncbi:MAG: InlB B-repeat-containing protein [Synergistaceae bacterium]|nr:InlB B-repeat-containing protein [Synergistaceae bacterium]